MLSRYEQFSSIISAIYRRVQKIERDEMVKYGYKGAYAQYLSAINRHPEGVTAGQLCEICDKDKAAISRVTAEMEQKGLIRRGGSSIYRAKLTLTDEGKRLAHVVSQRASVAVDLVGADLSDDERCVFYAALEGIAQRLQQVEKTGLPNE